VKRRRGPEALVRMLKRLRPREPATLRPNCHRPAAQLACLLQQGASAPRFGLSFTSRAHREPSDARSGLLGATTYFAHAPGHWRDPGRASPRLVPNRLFSAALHLCGSMSEEGRFKDCRLSWGGA
jgi:hypothetical protein